MSWIRKHGTQFPCLLRFARNRTFLRQLGMGATMQKYGAAWLGSLGLILAIGIGAAAAQTPSAGANALDQVVPDTPSPSLSPTSGLTFDTAIGDTPIGSDLLREMDSNQSGPSDGLRLQFYDMRSPTPAMGGAGDHNAQGSQNP